MRTNKDKTLGDRERTINKVIERMRKKILEREEITKKTKE